MDNMNMNEQSFVPESQSQQSQGQHSQDEQHIDYTAQPYYWSTKPDSPKDEPASLYDEPMVQSDTSHEYQRGYSMHNNADAGYDYSIPSDSVESSTRTGQPSATYSQQSQSRSRYQQQQYSPDGDAFERQYRYGSAGNATNANNWQWSAPVWARPPRQRGFSSRWFWFILLAIIFMGPLMHLLGFLLVAGVIFLALLFPLVIVGLLSIPFLLSRALLGGPFPQRRWRYMRFWRMNDFPWLR